MGWQKMFYQFLHMLFGGQTIKMHWGDFNNNKKGGKAYLIIYDLRNEFSSIFLVTGIIATVDFH